jgi:hypothetical protein
MVVYRPTIVYREDSDSITRFKLGRIRKQGQGDWAIRLTGLIAGVWKKGECNDDIY